ncbi:MAG: M23 family metallopeptidase [Bacilli bacterium]|nr:M23 family metallopeptidase [Bacilli bacterium]
MKQRKLRGYVLPTLYVLLLILIFGTVSVITTMLHTNPDYLYSIGVLKNVSTLPVVGEIDGSASDGILRPYASDKVSVDKYFYDIKDDEEKQQNSLIYYENTYMKNTGVLYKAEEEFDVLAVLSGTVSKIKEDKTLGNVVEIEHNTNLRTIYYGVDNLDIKVGDVLTQGETIGTSGTSNISSSKHSLLFEVYYNGTLINPEEFYSMDAATLN